MSTGGDPKAGEPEGEPGPDWERQAERLMARQAERAADSQADTKTCPYCAETIKQAAPVCRFCPTALRTGRMLQEAPASAQPPRAVQARTSVVDGLKLGCGMFLVLPIVLTILGLAGLVMFATLCSGPLIH